MLKRSSVFILDRFAQSYMAQNYSPENLGICAKWYEKPFITHSLQKKPLNNGHHILVHVIFVYLSGWFRLTFEYKNQLTFEYKNLLFHHGFLFIFVCICICMYLLLYYMYVFIFVFIIYYVCMYYYLYMYVYV